MSKRLKQIVPIDPEVERVWEEFWRDIVTDHGEPNLDLIKRELFDYHTALHEVPKVYDAITHGRFTKPNTTAQVILDCVEEFHGQGQGRGERSKLS